MICLQHCVPCPSAFPCIRVRVRLARADLASSPDVQASTEHTSTEGKPVLTPPLYRLG